MLLYLTDGIAFETLRLELGDRALTLLDFENSFMEDWYMGLYLTHLITSSS
jgi:hypothetical protein